MGLSVPGNFDGDMMFWHHAICAAHRRPTGLLRALTEYKEATPTLSAVLGAMAKRGAAGDIVRVLWSHPSRVRAVVELKGGKYALFTDVDDKRAVVVDGSMDDVLASVPDEDFEAAVRDVKAGAKTTPKPKEAASSSDARKAALLRADEARAARAIAPKRTKAKTKSKAKTKASGRAPKNEGGAKARAKRTSAAPAKRTSAAPAKRTSAAKVATSRRPKKRP